MAFHPATPPHDTAPGTLHWLYRPTGAPHWTVATWTAKGWNFCDGWFSHPAQLPYWQYAAPAEPPAAAIDQIELVERVNVSQRP